MHHVRKLFNGKLDMITTIKRDHVEALKNIINVYLEVSHEFKKALYKFKGTIEYRLLLKIVDTHLPWIYMASRLKLV